MKRVLLICLSLVLALVGGSSACAEDGFYVIPAMKGNYAPVPKTGQTLSRVLGDDGNLQKGVASPTPRFTDNNNGTVTDKLTGLIWMKHANYAGLQTWQSALNVAASMRGDLPRPVGDYGPVDGSKPGDWRLPNVRELQSLVDYGKLIPALPAGHPFTNVLSSYYWSSSTYEGNAILAWSVDFLVGFVNRFEKSDGYSVWCVRAGP
jgi:hypothetical protein